MSDAFNDVVNALIDGMDDEFEPKVDERLWFRSSSTGDRGYLVKRDGIPFIRLDRPAEEILQPYEPSRWAPETEDRPLTPLQCAQVAFEADKRLCYFLGEHEASRRAWLDLSDRQRIDFMKKGPSNEGKSGRIRAGQWHVIRRYLEPYAVK